MNNIRLSLPLLIAGIMAASPAFAQTPQKEANHAETDLDSRKGFGLAVRASTLGLGIEGIISLNQHFNLRAQGNFLNYDREIDEDGVKYQGKLKFQTLGVLADWHPFAGSFRVSGGAYNNGNKITLNADAACPASEPCEVGDLEITNDPTNPPRIDGEISFNSFSPYAGLGWGNAMKGGPIHFGLDIGVLFQGAPQFALAASGRANVRDTTQPNGPNNPRNNVDLASDPQVQQELRDEEMRAADESGEYKLYPVISLTLGYRF